MSEKQTWLQRLVELKDRRAILICLAIATVFWLTNALSGEYTHDYTFNLDYQLQPNVSFASAPREKMEARISGSGWELLMASFKRHFRDVPISVVRPELTRSDLIAALYEHLSGYEVVVREVNIDVLSLDINMVITRTLQVDYARDVTCANGFVFLDSAHLEPSTVTVTGPASLIERLGRLQVDAPEVTALTEDLDQVVNVVLPESEYLEVDPKQVHVVAKVEPEVAITAKLPIKLTGDTALYDLPRRTVNLTYRVGQSHQSDPILDSIAVIANINAMAIEQGVCSLSVRNQPPFIQELDLAPRVLPVRERNEN